MSEDNVIRFPAGGPDLTFGKIEPKKVLGAAFEDAEEFDSAMIIGWKKDGSLFVASTEGYLPDNITLLEVVKAEYIQMAMGE